LVIEEENSTGWHLFQAQHHGLCSMHQVHQWLREYALGGFAYSRPTCSDISSNGSSRGTVPAPALAAANRAGAVMAGEMVAMPAGAAGSWQQWHQSQQLHPPLHQNWKWQHWQHQKQQGWQGWHQQHQRQWEGHALLTSAAATAPPRFFVLLFLILVVFTHI